MACNTMSEIFDSVLDSHLEVSGDLESVFTLEDKKMDLLSASMQDSGILRPQNEGWLMDNETDELLNSILTGTGDTLLGIDGTDSTPDFDQQLLSPADSSSSGNSGNTGCQSVDLIDMFANDAADEEDLQGVNPHTNSPETPQEAVDNSDEKKPVARVMLKAHRNHPKRVASTNVYHHAGVQNKPSISVVRPSTITSVPAAANGATPITLAGQTHAAAAPAGSLETGTTTIYLPYINAKQVQQQPTIIRMSAPAHKRRRTSASSSDSGSDDSSVTEFQHPRFNGCGDRSKYPRLELTAEERKLCEKENVSLPTHYPLTKEEERNLKRIRRKIRNKQSAQDSRKRKKEHVENMEARAMRCAQENAELVKKLNVLEAQNKTLVGQLKRLHQIIVNRGGINASNAVAQAAMGHKGQTSTALMVLLLSTALFLIPGMKQDVETKPTMDISQALKGPPIPGQSRSLLHFAAPQNNIKEEYPANTQAPTQTALENSKNTLLSAFRDHDYVVTAAAAAPAAAAKKDKKTSYIVADEPPLGYGDQTLMLGHNISQEVVVVTTDSVKKEAEDEDERRLNVSVTGGPSGARTVVLHVPKGIK